MWVKYNNYHSQITDMGIKKILITAVIIILLTKLSYANNSSSSSCMLAYNKGGAPAVLDSLHCVNQWVDLIKKSTKDCEFASLQGHRKYQEDRVTCNLDISIFGKDAVSEAKVDLLAVFDGHGGAEASEMARQHLLDYILVHVIAAALKKSSNFDFHNDFVTAADHAHKLLLDIDDKSLNDILKEALLGALRDIDQEFSLEAVKKHYSAGSTASVVLLLNDKEFLVANVGDSKVILCAEYAEELTHDHHPDREDERARIEQAGGFVLNWDVPRVNGILAMSRAIGDVSLKSYGVIAIPEMVGWRKITTKDQFLVVASDGVFESLTPENVCQLIEVADIQENGRTPYDKSPFLPSFSLAYNIVKTALDRGSTDNLSAIVLPLAHVNVTGEALIHKDEL